MRWKLNIRPGEDEVRTWFAWFPITLGLETRWLEKVKVIGYWRKNRDVFPMSDYEWVSMYFQKDSDNK